MENQKITALYDQYKKDLSALYEIQKSEHDVLVKKIMQRDNVSEDKAREIDLAENDVWIHDGRAIYIIRKYWLEVDKLKQAAQENSGSWEEPLTFLVERLQDDGEDELVEYLTQIAYWPIGIDSNGQWV